MDASTDTPKVGFLDETRIQAVTVDGKPSDQKVEKSKDAYTESGTFG